MRRPARVLMLLLVVPATFYFTLFVPFILLPRVGWLPQIVALVCAAAVGRWTWRRMDPGGEADREASLAGIGALLVGSVGFLAGFIGPMILGGGAQGPLLGIFLTGPIGIVVGLATGAAVSPTRVAPATARAVLGVVAVVVGGLTLVAGIPVERGGGYLLDLTGTGCEVAADGVAAAAASWETRLREHPGWSERGGWQGEVARMTAATPGVKLEVDLHSRRHLAIRNRPWERGEVRAEEWSRGRTAKGWYFLPVATGGCEGVPLGERRLAYIEEGGGDEPLPPEDLAGFLGLSVLQEVPPAFAAYAERDPGTP